MFSLPVSKNYNKEKFQRDLFAGVTTAILLIPQAMAYAVLAGLPSYVGLYAAAIPLIAYAFLGTSRSLAIGPVAMDSLLTATAVGAIASATIDSGDPNPQYLMLASLLALMVGGVQILMGLLKLGRLVKLLTPTIISAFTSAAALIIGINQVKLILGIDLPRSTKIFEILASTVERIGETNIPTLIIGLASIVILIVLKKKFPKFPRAFAVVLLGATAVMFLNLQAENVKVVGELPVGLPDFKLPDLSMENIVALGLDAVVIAMVAFMEAISVGTRLKRKDETLEASQELVAIGASNVLSGVFQGFPVTGGFSRSAVNDSAGAESRLASLITAAGVMITLLFFTALLTPIPKAVLGAIIMTAVFGLISISDFLKILKENRSQLPTYLVTFGVTLLVGIQQGMVLGVGFNWLLSKTILKDKNENTGASEEELEENAS